MVPSDAYIIIIGAMKCGTTTLYSDLSRQPDICPSKEKEPNFFSRTLVRRGNVETYEDLWEFDPRRHRYVIEASTGYSKFPMDTGVPERMKEYGIQPHLIYLVRDPIERIESDYNFSRDKFWFDRSEPMTAERYLCVSRYFTQLEQYRRVFGPEKITVIEFGDLVRRRREVLSDLRGKLGLPPLEIAAPSGRQNVTRVPPSELRMLAKNIPGLIAVAKLVPGSLRRRLRNSPAFSNKRLLSDRERAMVRESLREEMTSLKREYAVPVEQWGF